VDQTADRVAWNESAFREVNERMRALAVELDRTAEFVCECASVGCADRLSLSVDEYERTRTNSRRFVLVAGHQRPEFERVVENRDGWVVVEKTGQAGAIASLHDPRTA
jgi:hypothetical protein